MVTVAWEDAGDTHITPTDNRVTDKIRNRETKARPADIQAKNSKHIIIITDLDYKGVDSMRHKHGFQSRRDPFGHTLLMLLGCVLPIIIFFALALSGVAISPVWFFLFIMICCAAMFFFMGGAPMHEEEAEQAAEEAAPSEEDKNVMTTLANNASDVMWITSQERGGDSLVLRGKLLVDPDTAYERLQRKFESTDTSAVLQEDEAGKPIIVLKSGTLKSHDESKRSPWLNIILFILTLGTTTSVGAAYQGINLWSEPWRFAAGLPYALGLMIILGAHELGHYFTARAHNMKVTLPYFIPVPFALGTFGAFIQMKSPSKDRRALFDVGIAGPLAGLVFAIPALLIGLHYSTVLPAADTTTMLQRGSDVGSSVLFTLLAKLSLGDRLIEGHNILMSPLAFAGWLGILVTALNLLPIGQLDGGHVAHALFGRKKAETIGMVALFALFLLALFVWSGLLIWAIIVFFIAGIKSPPPLNDFSKLDSRRVAVGAFAFVLLFLMLTPVPHSFYQALGIYCPYA